VQPGMTVNGLWALAEVTRAGWRVESVFRGSAVLAHPRKGKIQVRSTAEALWATAHQKLSAVDWHTEISVTRVPGRADNITTGRSHPELPRKKGGP